MIQDLVDSPLLVLVVTFLTGVLVGRGVRVERAESAQADALTEAPSGVVLLEFSGGATMRLEVECLEAELADLGSSWTAAHCPAHAVDDTAPKSKRA